MISVVILNWKRPDNIVDHILPKLVNYKLVSEIIISHGNSKTYFQTPELNIVKHYQDEKLNANLGVALRFSRSCDAKNDCILIIDDDMLPSENYVNRMYKEYKKNPNVVIGSTKRYVSATNGYSIKGFLPDDQQIVLTQILMTNKTICKDFMNEKNKMNDFALKAKPVWNGEDILFNLIYIKNYNKTPIHLKPNGDDVTKLKTNNAISSDAGHHEYRQNFSKAALERYDIDTINYIHTNVLVFVIVILLLIIYITR
jgi:hypothetical protein